ncbi:hypothetical protein CYMTET_44051 [Cymbomonas tetramitiformis]|uniref:Uncharacterized protein n=1 Tax=Cymbomonas tetramitiformis TaxID=36881 RepID=A0AAE0EZE7_9CHLO|nr:hypothetical protein CYMTET_44051 [Cymbomonas tetramitiformis]
MAAYVAQYGVEKSTQTFTIVGDEVRCVRNQDIETAVRFTVGAGQQDGEKPDGSITTFIPTWDGEKLVVALRDGTTMVREAIGDEMILTLKCQDVVATLTHEKREIGDNIATTCGGCW